MNYNIWKKFLVLIVIFLCSNILNAKENFSMNGKVDVKLINTGIDNESIDGYPPDFSSDIFLNLNGKLNELNYRSRIDVIYDRFDSAKIKRINFAFTKKNLLVELGQVRASFSEFTLLNRELLGLLYAQNFYRGGLEIDPSSADNIRLQLLKVPVRHKENLEEVMHLARTNMPLFSKTKIMVVFGQTEHSVELGDKVDFQNGRYSQRVIFQQAGYGFRIESWVTSYVQLALNLFAVEDDEKSINQAIGPNQPITPISTKAGSIETRWKLLNDKWEIMTEVARNQYNPNLYLGSGNRKRDGAYKAAFLSNTKIVDCDVELKRIEPDYYTGGNQSTLSTNDRQGVFSIFNIRPYRYNNLRARINVYRDNLNSQLSKTTTYSMYELGWNLNVPLWPLFNLTFRHNRENSTMDPTDLTMIKKNRTNFAGINIAYPIGPITLNSLYSLTDYNDENVYSSTLPQNDYRNNNFYIGLSSSPIKDLNIQVNYSHNSTNFKETFFKSIDRRGGVFISYDILPDKLQCVFEGNIGKSDNESYKVKKKYFRVGFDLSLNKMSKLLLEIKKDNEDYTPDDSLREYDAIVAQLRYQRRF